MDTAHPIPFDNSYARLPRQMFTHLSPTPVSEPGPIRVNRELAALLGIDGDWLASPAGTAVIAGNALPAGAEPLAAVYAGHQFGSYNPQLGDGRALLLGEVIGTDGARYDIQLKGSGPTPYSRGGDGRSPLGPVLREYLVSEAMHRLGVPTTRALAAVTTGEQVRRERFLPGAVLARVASSHIRIGTFQYFAVQGDGEALAALRDHVVARHFPDAAAADNPTLALLESVVAAQASLVARWQLLGFIHGVMNTDNMLLSGETVDYGPCAFMDEFHPDTVFSSIDRGGRYAYRNQPGIAQWNLAVLAQSLLPLLDEDRDRAVELAQGAIDAFPERFLAAHQGGLSAKLGLDPRAELDTALVEDLFSLMTAEQLDFTLTFRHLLDLARPAGEPGEPVAALVSEPETLKDWLARWHAARTGQAGDAGERYRAMRVANPVFIPRNHLVEAAIAAATNDGDFGPFERLAVRLERPFDYDPAERELATPPRPEQVVSQTFCGT